MPAYRSQRAPIRSSRPIGRCWAAGASAVGMVASTAHGSADRGWNCDRQRHAGSALVEHVTVGMRHADAASADAPTAAVGAAAGGTSARSGPVQSSSTAEPWSRRRRASVARRACRAGVGVELARRSPRCHAPRPPRPRAPPRRPCRSAAPPSVGAPREAPQSRRAGSARRGRAPRPAARPATARRYDSTGSTKATASEAPRNTSPIRISTMCRRV